MKSVIKKCTCQHEFQDRVHGKNNRVMNPCGKAGSKAEGEMVRCTVCHKEHKKHNN